jgi:FkbM family methyltransferase
MELIGKIFNFFKRKLIGLLSHDIHYQNFSYSQEGEDLILQRIFNDRKDGFYIDIGAHHPKRFSNTYIFYKKGWRGINIDPMPGSMSSFNKYRNGDINLEIGISSKEQELKYFIFNERALNTFNAIEAELKVFENPNKYFLKETKIIKTYSLATILNKYLKESQVIDFLSVDVEGLDLEVLKSNDWNKYKPNYILVEELRSTLEEVFSKSDVFNFFNELGYSLVSKTVNTSIYKKND